MKTNRLAMLCLLTLPAVACDESTDDGEATVRLSVYGEEFMEDRIPADEVVDGWEIDFSEFVVGLTDISVDGEALAGSYVFDLTQSSNGAGHPVADLTVPSGDVSTMGYRIAPAAASPDGGNASAEQQALMAGQGYSIYVSGTATRGGETKSFAWGFTNDTQYVNCGIDRSLAAGEEDGVEMTIHADHLFFDDLESEEPNVAFDIVARADADADGTVTLGELGGLDITGEARYQVGSRSISDLGSFVEAQTALVGHFDGEGHCDTQ